MTLFPPGQGFGGGAGGSGGSLQPFSKTLTMLTPAAGTAVAWRAPFACTVVKVWGFQDTGTGSVVTAQKLHGVTVTDLLNTDITISSGKAWQDGGSLAVSSLAVGDSIIMKVTSVSGGPSYVSIQVDLTQP